MPPSSVALVYSVHGFLTSLRFCFRIFRPDHFSYNYLVNTEYFLGMVSPELLKFKHSKVWVNQVVLSAHTNKSITVTVNLNNINFNHRISLVSYCKQLSCGEILTFVNINRLYGL